MRPFRPFRSFRLRLALFSMGCTAAILLLFGVAIDYWLQRTGIDVANRRLQRQARVLYESPFWPPPWKRLEPGLQAEWPDTVSLSLLLYVAREHDNRTAHISSDWPAGLDPRPWTSHLTLGDNWRDAAPPERPEHRGSPKRGEESPSISVLQVRPWLRRTVEFGGREWMITTFSARGYSTVLCVSRTAGLAHVYQLRKAFAVAFPGALVLSFAAAWLMVQRSLRPVRSLTRTVTRITAEGLDQRVDAPTEDREFARLVEVFNGMLDRLQNSFENAHRFTGNAAHELKTPLAILQGHLEEAIRSEEPASERQQFLTELLDEVARLKSITERLLLLSRADAGRLDLYIDTVDMSELLEAIAEDAALLAPHLELKTLIPRRIRARCDRALIAQVVHNMVANAIKYNAGDGGFVYVELGRMNGHVIVRVTNTGRPIPVQLHERIFERFNRGDRSRSERIDGVGLGLSLAREIARAHAGDLVLDDSTDERTRFVLKLPGGSRSPVERELGASSAFAALSNQTL